MQTPSHPRTVAPERSIRTGDLPWREILFLVLFLGIGGEAANGQNADQPLAFARQVVDAINSKNPEKRKELLHPKLLACFNSTARPFYEDTFSRQARHIIPPNYKSSVKAISSGAPLLFEENFEYPVRPTHQLQIDYETGPNRSRTLIVMTVHDGTGWREVWPCPKPETVQLMQAAKEASARRNERVKSLAAGVAEPLRSKILALTREGRKVDAIREYRDATGEDLAVAKDVVETLMSQQP